MSRLRVDQLQSDQSFIVTTGGVSLDMSTGKAIGLPRGTTAQRPTTSAAGLKVGASRFNTTKGKIEYYNGFEWVGFDGTKDYVTDNLAMHLDAANSGSYTPITPNDGYNPYGGTTNKLMGWDWNVNATTYSGSLTPTNIGTITYNSSGGVSGGYTSGFTMPTTAQTTTGAIGFQTGDTAALNAMTARTWVAWYRGRQSGSRPNQWCVKVPIFGDYRNSVYMALGIEDGKIGIGNANASVGTTNVIDNSWHCLVWTYSSQTGYIIGYVDGNPECRYKYSDVNSPQYCVMDCVGFHYPYAGVVSPTNLDGVQVFNAEFTPQQVKTLHDLGRVGIWKDVSGNGYNAVLAGTSYESANGGSLKFSGQTEDCAGYIYNVNDTSLPGVYEHFRPWTMNIWFKKNGNSSNASLNVVYDMMPTGSSGVWIAIDDAGTTGGSPQVNQIIFGSRPSGGGYSFISSGVIASVGTWYNVCITKNFTETRMYVNNVLRGTISGNLSTTTTSYMTVGRYTDGTVFSNTNIAVVQRYTKSLSAAEVEQNFNAFKGRFGY